VKPWKLGRLKRDADLSGDGLYRYKLSRIWDERPVCVFIGMNPSIADADRDDPTARRMMSFACDWGFGGIEVYNLFAAIATSPGLLFSRDVTWHNPKLPGQPVLASIELPGPADPVGPKNDVFLLRAVTQEHVGMIVAAWGATVSINPGFTHRAREVEEMLKGVDMDCLALTKDGEPRHPLYTPAIIKPIPYMRNGVRAVLQPAHDVSSEASPPCVKPGVTLTTPAAGAESTSDDAEPAGRTRKGAAVGNCHG
jgi:hypothetical protein